MQPSRLTHQHKLWIIVIAAIVIYCYHYLIIPEAPGHDAAHMEGWWGWYDQGQYLKAAIAFGAGDFSPSSHYYPPLYPYIGHLFYGLIPRDPFFFIDGAAFVLFSYAFIKASSKYIGFPVAFIAFYFSVASHHEIIKHFVIPWTTTITVISYSVCLLGLSNLQNKSSLSKKELISYPALLSLAMALLGLARPIDALLAGVFFLAYLIMLYVRIEDVEFKKRAIKLIPTVIIFIIGPVISIVIFALFNEKVFGTIQGGYVNSTATSSGYFITELIQKSVSLLFDAGSLFAVPGEGIVEHYPWIAVSIAGMLLCLFIGDAFLRTLAIALVIHFCLYAPYGDLLPVGVWRYGNIHYFKWGIPYLMLFALVAIYWCVPKFKFTQRKSLFCLIYVVVASLAILSFSFSTTEHTQETKLEGSTLEILYDTPATVKFIDIPGIADNYIAIYFGEHKLWNGDKELMKIHDFRLIPTSYGARLYFNRPIQTSGIKLQFDPAITFSKPITQVESASYGYQLSLAKLKSSILRGHHNQN